MKRFFYSVLAAATMLFATTSCSQDEEIVSGGTTQSGTTQKVKFSVQLPDQTESRAIAEGVEVGKGNMANSLRWALYEVDNNGNIVGNGPLETRMIEQETTDKEFNVSIDMVKGLKYKVLFLAYNKDNCIFNLADEDNDGDGDGDDLMSLDYKTTLVSNEEGYDAFVACHPHTVNTEAVTTVTLYRPFAQINAATSDLDLQKAKKLNATVTKSQLVINQVPTKYNVFNSEVSEYKNIDFTATNYLKNKDSQTNEKINVEGTDYNYLNMVYVLAGEDNTTSSTHTATFNFYRGDNGDDLFRTFTIEHLPIERNFRTNVIGDLITQTEAFKIVIDADFMKPDIDVDETGARLIADVADMQKAIEDAIDGQEMKLKLVKDVKLSETLDIPEKKVITIDLNGKFIEGNWAKSNGAVIENNGTMILTGGTVKSTGDNGGSAIMNNGTLTVKDAILNGAPNADASWPSYAVNNTGTLTVENTKITSVHGAVCSYEEGAVVTLNNSEINMTGIPGFTSHGIYTYDKGKVVVNDGTYENKATDQNATGASVINGYVEVNSGSFTGRIENYYGTPVLKGGNYSEEPKTAFVAAGYSTVEKGGIYYVVKGDVTNASVITTKEDLIALSAKALTSNNGTQEEATIVIVNDIDMQGAKFSAIIAQRGDKLTVLGNGHTISNVKVVSGDNDNTTGQASMFYAYPNSTLTVSDLTLKDITVTADANGTGYAAAVIGYCEGAAILNNVDVVNATVTGVKSSGMLVGHMSGSLTANNCELSGKVILADFAEEAAGHYAGKYIGTLAGPAKMNNCSVDVTVSGNLNAKNIGEVYGRKTTAGSSNVEFVSDNTSLSSSIEKGTTSIILDKGTYIIPDKAKGKSLTIIGTGNPADTKIATQDDGSYEGCDYSLDGSTVVFENITITTDSKTYTGYARCTGTYKNCIINGTYTLYGNSTFENCTFNVSGDVYNIWTWGAEEATFQNCTFNSDGKAMLLYSTVNTKLTIENCIFNDNGGLSDLKAAIEIGNDYDKSYQLIVNKTTVNGYEINDKGINTNTTLWANKNSMPKEKLNVVVDGVDVY